jgi:hypothetical protein
MWAMIIHLTGICCSVILPVILWQVKKQNSPFIDDQGKEAVSYQLIVVIAWVVIAILARILSIFALFYLVLFLANLILCVLAGVKANSGGVYRYPIALRLFK